jgi:hypothetical protein
MNHDALMAYVIRIMLPMRWRDYFVMPEGGLTDWSEPSIPEEEGNAMIDYDIRLKKMIVNPNPLLFRTFLESNSNIYEDEAEIFLRLKDSELISIMRLISIEKGSKFPEGRC